MMSQGNAGPSCREAHCQLAVFSESSMGLFGILHPLTKLPEARHNVRV